MEDLTKTLGDIEHQIQQMEAKQKQDRADKIAARKRSIRTGEQRSAAFIMGKIDHYEQLFLEKMQHHMDTYNEKDQTDQICTRVDTITNRVLDNKMVNVIDSDDENDLEDAQSTREMIKTHYILVITIDLLEWKHDFFMSCVNGVIRMLTLLREDRLPYIDFNLPMNYDLLPLMCNEFEETNDERYLGQIDKQFDKVDISLSWPKYR